MKRGVSELEVGADKEPQKVSVELSSSPGSAFPALTIAEEYLGRGCLNLRDKLPSQVPLFDRSKLRSKIRKSTVGLPVEDSVFCLSETEDYHLDSALCAKIAASGFGDLSVNNSSCFSSSSESSLFRAHKHLILDSFFVEECSIDELSNPARTILDALQKNKFMIEDLFTYFNTFGTHYIAKIFVGAHAIFEHREDISSRRQGYIEKVKAGFKYKLFQGSMNTTDSSLEHSTSKFEGYSFKLVGGEKRPSTWSVDAGNEYFTPCGYDNIRAKPALLGVELNEVWSLFPSSIETYKRCQDAFEKFKAYKAPFLSKMITDNSGAFESAPDSPQSSLAHVDTLPPEGQKFKLFCFANKNTFGWVSRADPIYLTLNQDKSKAAIFKLERAMHEQRFLSLANDYEVVCELSLKSNLCLSQTKRNRARCAFMFGRWWVTAHEDYFDGWVVLSTSEQEGHFLTINNEAKDPCVFQFCPEEK